MVKQILFILVFLSMVSYSQVVFESGWENAIDSLSEMSILDGGLWDEIVNDSEPYPSYESVDFNFKHTGNAALRYNWVYATGYSGTGQDVGVRVNNLNIPNPYYVRY